MNTQSSPTVSVPLGQSPAVNPVVAPAVQIVERQQMDFPSALRKLIDGARITKLEWKNENWFCLLHGSFLKIHRADDPADFYREWIVAKEDLLGTDWVVIGEEGSVQPA